MAKIKIISWSGGKDSTAQIIIAHEKGEPIDYIIFSEVLFSAEHNGEEISGELPEHIQFIKSCIPLFESWGFKVVLLKSEVSFLDLFYHTITHSKDASRNGLMSGFPMAGACVVQGQCKKLPIKNFLASLGGEQNCIQYIGIGTDESDRLERLDGTFKISLLEKYGLTEKDAYELCRKYNLLSPIYRIHSRGGCFFCPNQSKKQLFYLYKEHRELYDKLCDLEGIPYTVGSKFNTLSGRSLSSLRKVFEFENSQMTIFDLM